MATPDDSASDADLAARAARGDREALDALLARHVDRIHGVCRRVLGDPDDALDATQEALLAVAKGIAGFDGRSQLSTWLYRVATNAALDETRRRARRPLPVEAVRDRPGTAPGVDDVVADRLDVDAALAGLAPEFRAAVALRDLADLDYAAIAEALDVPIGTVRSRIARGRAALADALGNRPLAPERPMEQR
jgi:RNA polymerase sigma-70 factor (ECF subfamily)